MGNFQRIETRQFDDDVSITNKSMSNEFGLMDSVGYKNKNSHLSNSSYHTAKDHFNAPESRSKLFERNFVFAKS